MSVPSPPPDRSHLNRKRSHRIFSDSQALNHCAIVSSECTRHIIIIMLSSMYQNRLYFRTEFHRPNDRSNFHKVWTGTSDKKNFNHSYRFLICEVLNCISINELFSVLMQSLWMHLSPVAVPTHFGRSFVFYNIRVPVGNK